MKDEEKKVNEAEEEVQTEEEGVELTDEELEQVTGGMWGGYHPPTSVVE